MPPTVPCIDLRSLRDGEKGIGACGRPEKEYPTIFYLKAKFDSFYARFDSFYDT